LVEEKNTTTNNYFYRRRPLSWSRWSPCLPASCPAQGDGDEKDTFPPVHDPFYYFLFSHVLYFYVDDCHYRVRPRFGVDTREDRWYRVVLMAQSPEARIQFLRQQRRAMETELRHLLGTALPHPEYHCKRCGYTWRGRYANRSPEHCARCHSSGWRTEPTVQREPNPERVFNGRPRPVSIARRPWDDAAPDTLPPPPAATLPMPSLSSQFRRRVEEPPQPERIVSDETMRRAAELENQLDNSVREQDVALISVPTEPNLTESVVETPVDETLDYATLVELERVKDAAVKELIDKVDEYIAADMEAISPRLVKEVPIGSALPGPGAVEGDSPSLRVNEGEQDV
jgi:hypothetical protein